VSRVVAEDNPGLRETNSDAFQRFITTPHD
jgi:hypothetical protein